MMTMSGKEFLESLGINVINTNDKKVIKENNIIATFKPSFKKLVIK